MQQRTMGRPHVVIVGAGFGGLLAAQHLRTAPVNVTVIDRSNHHLFQPLLYQVATAGLSPADISAPVRSILRGQRNAEVFLAEVTGIDTAKQTVQVGDRAIPYDYLVLATGARHSYFGHDDWEPFAPGLKSIADATAIRRKILFAFEAAELTNDPVERRALLTFVVVGGGPTGVELAGAIAELAHKALIKDFRHIDPSTARIVLVEAQAEILTAFPAELAQQARKHLQRLGVEVRTPAAVAAVDAVGVMIGEERLAARTVIWAAGVQASQAGAWLHVPTDRAGRVLVGPDLTAPAHPNVFVIGDTATVSAQGKPLPGVAPVAMQQGRYVAQAIAARVAGQATTAPFVYRDKGNLATVGQAFAIMHKARFKISGFPAWLLWIGIHILYLIDFRNRLLVMMQWAWAYFSYSRGVRLIVSEDEPAHLPQQVKQPTSA